MWYSAATEAAERALRGEDAADISDDDDKLMDVNPFKRIDKSQLVSNDVSSHVCLSPLISLISHCCEWIAISRI